LRGSIPASRAPAAHLGESELPRAASQWPTSVCTKHAPVADGRVNCPAGLCVVYYMGYIVQASRNASIS